MFELRFFFDANIFGKSFSLHFKGPLRPGDGLSARDSQAGSFFGSAPAQGLPPPLGGHTFPETMVSDFLDIRGLKCPLHTFSFFSKLHFHFTIKLRIYIATTVTSSKKSDYRNPGSLSYKNHSKFSYLSKIPEFTSPDQIHSTFGFYNHIDTQDIEEQFPKSRYAFRLFRATKRLLKNPCLMNPNNKTYKFFQVTEEKCLTRKSRRVIMDDVNA